MKNKKGNVAVIAIIVAVVAVTVSVITWLVATRTQTPAQKSTTLVPTAQPAPATPPRELANWQDYRNEKYSFEIKYPNSWFIYESKSSIPGELSVPFGIFIQPTKEEEGNMPGPHADALYLEIIDSSGPLDDALVASLESNKSIKYEKIEATIGGVMGMKVTSICEGVGCGNPDWFVVKGKYLYKFYSQLGNSKDFEKIISTFKFTK